MKSAVLDEAVPADAAALLSTARLSVAGFPVGWRGMVDGDVLDLASEAGFDWLITCDKRMPFQQNLAGRTVSVLVLPSARLPVIELLKEQLRKVLRNPVPGHFVHVDDTGRLAGAPAPHLQGRNRS